MQTSVTAVVLDTPPPRRLTLRPEDHASRNYLLGLPPISRLIAKYPSLVNTIDESYTVIRTGLFIRGVPHETCESIGGHTANLTHDTRLIPQRICDEDGLDRDDMAVKSLVHDPFVETGKGWDIPPFAYCGIPKKEKERLELIWLDENVAKLEPGAGELIEDWYDYNYGRTPSARMVKQLDKVRAAVEARKAREIPEYIVKSEFIAGARPQIRHPFVKHVLEKWGNTAGSGTDTEEVYREILQDHAAYISHRMLLAVVSRNSRTDAYRAAFA